MADDLTADVTIRNESTGEEKVIPAGAVPYFTQPESSWVALTAAGHRKPAATTTKGD